MKDLEYHLYEEAKAGRLTRQQVLVRASVLGVSASALGTMPAEFQDGPKSLSEASVPEVNAPYRSQRRRPGWRYCCRRRPAGPGHSC